MPSIRASTGKCNFFAIGTKIAIHNNGLLGEAKIESFYLDVGRIIVSFHFSMGTFGNQHSVT